MGVPSTNGCKNVSLILPDRCRRAGVRPRAVAHEGVRHPGTAGEPAHSHGRIGAALESVVEGARAARDVRGRTDWPLPAVIAAAPGLALWLAEDSFLQVLRFDTRGPFATDFEPPSYLDTDDRYTSPDRLPGTDVNFSVGTGARSRTARASS